MPTENYTKMTLKQLLKADKYGKTMLHYAAYIGEIKEVPAELLRNIPMDDNGWLKVDNEGKCPLDAVIKQYQLIDLLKQENFPAFDPQSITKLRTLWAYAEPLLIKEKTDQKLIWLYQSLVEIYSKQCYAVSHKQKQKKFRLSQN